MPHSETNVLEFVKPATRDPAPFGDTGGMSWSITQGPRTTPLKVANVRGSSALAPIEIDKLYPADKHSSSDLVVVLAALAEASNLLESARLSSRANDAISADRYTQRFQTLLPSLFARRKIGDGYGGVINSLHFALINQRGKPLSMDQLTTVWRVVKELRNSPFIPFEQALTYVEELENCNLQVDPSALGAVIEEFGDE